MWACPVARRTAGDGLNASARFGTRSAAVRRAVGNITIAVLPGGMRLPGLSIAMMAVYEMT